MRHALVCALLLVACKDPSSSKPKAGVGEAHAEVAPSKVLERLPFSADDSSIAFTASKVTRTHHGGFRKFDGLVELGETPEQSRVSVTIDASTIYADDDGLTRHLRTADFFDVDKFPTATFTSTAIVNSPSGDATHLVTGNLEMHGVTKSITFPATIHVTEGAVEVDAEFAINRKDWKLVYPGVPDDLIRDNVVITLHVRASRDKPT